MRRALGKCVPSQLVLFDFLAPRLYTSSRTRSLTGSTSRPYLQVSESAARNISTTAKTRATATKSSILDAASNSEGDLSYHAAHLYKCALAGDILSVWSAYGQIHSEHRRLVLGPEHYGALSMMLVKKYDHILSTADKSDEELHAMEELAFACAGAGYVDGLRQMLVWRLVRSESDKVISAFERFEQTLLLDESGLEKVTTPPDADTVEDDENEELRLANPDISRLDIANIMAVTVAAYAAQERFQDAVQFILQHPTYRVTGDNMETLGEELKACGMYQGPRTALVPMTRYYIDAGGLALLVQRPEAFKAHLRNLVKERRVGHRLDKLRARFTAAFNGKHAWAAATESQQSPTRPIVVPEKIWAHLIHSYIVLRNEDSARALWADVIRWGRQPGTEMFNALLEGYRDVCHLPKLLHTWQVMEKQGIPFDARSYGAKLGALVLDREAGHYSLKLFDEFKATRPNEEDSLFVYNTVLNNLLLRFQRKRALALLDEMKKRGPQPDIVSYNTFIAHYAKLPDLQEIAKVVRELTEAGIEPDVFTFTSILSALLKTRISNGAERLLGIMDMMGVKQNVATYSAIIDSQVREGTKVGITAAWQVLQQMERMKDVEPNIVTYTSFLAGLHRSRELDKDLITSISSDVVQTMKKRGMRLKLGTYHILLKACLENPNPEALDFFMDYFNMMRRNGVPLWHDTWYIILDGLVRREEWDLATEMKNQMLDSGFQPMWGVAKRMRLIESWEARNRKGLGTL
ncbi:hypothetical protein A7U60_g7325 [Sanghuangporus baumii]|uniref:Pentacotripeptide-repeat region of PRORP domain-containing protein n=1 Tax=Sanghuangporus baumii TaxID=108892 RepID=A0A9Q5HTJ0_SANBA|nr:hypothetical protein A7U60_g7325 [Sanghuangporus baumii]